MSKVYEWTYDNRRALQLLLSAAWIVLLYMRPPSFRLIEGGKVQKWSA